MPFVQSQGALVTLDRRPPYPTLPAQTLRISDWLTQDYGAIYRSQSAVRSIVGFIARNVAQLGLGLYRRLDDDNRERLRDHPAAELLGTPNPADRRMTTYRWVHSIIQDLCVYDWALQVKATDGVNWGLVRWLPTRFTPIGNGFWPEEFELRSADGQKKRIPATDAIFFQGSVGIDDALMSIPPIESLRQTLVEEYESTRQRAEFWRNGARTSGFFEHPSKLSDTSHARLQASFRERYTRGGGNAGGVPILEEGMKYVDGGTTTARDAQYVEARKLTREECAAAWHVPPAMAGITAQAPFASIQEQHRMLYQDTLGPWLQMFQQDLNAQLIPDFADSDGVYVEFNIAEKMRGAFDQQAAALQSAVGAPWMTRNEARKLDNKPPIAGGDALIVPLNVIEGGLASPRDTAPPNALAVVGTLNARARRVVNRHVERWSGELARTGIVNTDRWLAELTAALPDPVKSAAIEIVAFVANDPDPGSALAQLRTQIAPTREETE